MAEGGTTTRTGIYCRGCDYDLRESTARCPECGRPFDAANPKTFYTSPRSRRVRRWIRRIVLLLLLVTLPPALGLGWLWWGWKAEQGHIAMLEQAGWRLEGDKCLYAWLPDCLPSRCLILADRADRICLPSMQPRERDMQSVSRLTRLRGLTVLSGKVTDNHVQHLRPLTRLEDLCLHGPISDDGLSHLSGLNRMQYLSLIQTRITGAGLRHLNGMTQLGWLVLDISDVDDEGLSHLEGMASLELLSLGGTAITDAGLEHLRELRKLKSLNLQDTRVTSAGVERLQAALPKLSISWAPSPAPATAPAPAPAPAGGD